MASTKDSKTDPKLLVKRLDLGRALVLVRKITG